MYEILNSVLNKYKKNDGIDTINDESIKINDKVRCWFVDSQFKQ